MRKTRVYIAAPMTNGTGKAFDLRNRAFLKDDKVLTQEE